MRESDSPEETLRLQISISSTMLHLLSAKERKRWTHEAAMIADRKPGCLLLIMRRVAVVLGVILAAVAFLVTLFSLAWYSSTTTFMRWVLLAVLCLMMMLMEILGHFQSLVLIALACLLNQYWVMKNHSLLSFSLNLFLHLEKHI
jgi:hypothetical protein